MKCPYIALSAAALAAVLCACWFLLGHTRVGGLHPALLAGQQEPAGRAAAESAWTIGIYTGPSPFQLSAPAEVSNPVLTAGDVSDLEVNIVAHPFMVVEDSLYYMFFTAKNDRTKQGGIGLAVSKNGMDWEYRRIVLDEPYDLSYPYVFKWQDDYFMIPEAHTETSLRLYRATDFPDKWTYDTDLLTGDHFISASVVRYNGMWWMFVARLGNETLRLFHAPELRGPWTEHPRSPVVEKNLDTARPGGRLLILDGTLYRLGQDCYPTYGNQVFAYQVIDISTTVYQEKVIDVPLVKATSEGWNAEAMHHVDLHRTGDRMWIAAVDALGK